MEFRFSNTSNRRLDTCCQELRLIMRTAIAHHDCPFDFGVICGFRGEGEQNKAYVNGNSNAKWGESDHNFMKGENPWSLAVDIGPFADGDYVWDQGDLRHEFLATHVLSVAAGLGYHLEWGGTYRLGKTGKPDKFHFSIKFK